jgi:hypothetical protein
MDLMRVWAALTGLLLIAGYCGALYLSLAFAPMLGMLAVAIGGFELALFGQDVWLKRRASRG